MKAEQNHGQGQKLLAILRTHNKVWGYVKAAGMLRQQLYLIPNFIVEPSGLYSHENGRYDL